MRSNDVALKYNSTLNETNTVGLRQKLAGGIAMNKGKKRRSKKSASAAKESKYGKLLVRELKDLCKKRKLRPR